MIVLENISKHYEKFSLNSFNLKIESGDFYALLGPNGAGKTTIIRMITGLTRIDAGNILINGAGVRNSSKKYLKDIGVMPQVINLEPELTVYENLKLHGMLFNMTSREIKKQIEYLLDLTELGDRASINANKLSGGMKRKLLLARAIMHDPEILLLDEPTIGLDVVFRKKVWELISKLNKKGKTILMTTHYLEEAEKLCRKFALINNGKLLFNGTKKDINNSKNINLEELYLNLNRVSE